MGNGNSIRARRRRRGKNIEWWKIGPKIKNRALRINSIKPCSFLEFEKLLHEKTYKSLGCSEMFVKDEEFSKGVYSFNIQQYVNDHVLRPYLAEKGLIFNGNN